MQQDPVIFTPAPPPPQLATWFPLVSINLVNTPNLSSEAPHDQSPKQIPRIEWGLHSGKERMCIHTVLQKCVCDSTVPLISYLAGEIPQSRENLKKWLLLLRNYFTVVDRQWCWGGRISPQPFPLVFWWQLSEVEPHKSTWQGLPRDSCWLTPENVLHFLKIALLVIMVEPRGTGTTLPCHCRVLLYAAISNYCGNNTVVALHGQYRKWCPRGQQVHGTVMRGCDDNRTGMPSR